MEEIKQTGGLSLGDRNNLEAYALYRCLQSDSLRLAALQAGTTPCPAMWRQPMRKCRIFAMERTGTRRRHSTAKQNGLGLHTARKLNGREMSYNNMVDAETVLEMLIDLSEYDGVPVEKPLSVIVKHANPCGVAYGESLADAYRLSFATDPKSAFGGVIGFSRPVDVDTARAIGDSFVEVLLAPGYEPEALKLLMEKKPNRRILDIGDLLARKDELYRGFYQRSIFGGMMLQDYDTGDLKEWKVVTKRAPTDCREQSPSICLEGLQVCQVQCPGLCHRVPDHRHRIGPGEPGGFSALWCGKGRGARPFHQRELWLPRIHSSPSETAWIKPSRPELLQ